VPNIKQQERRVRRAARERLENLHYRSTAKTLFRRLEAAVDDGDRERANEEHRELVRLLDKAAANGAVHPNKAARKKSQAARLLGNSDVEKRSRSK
jgi:small subunit ribosomal protein S20